MKKNIWIWNHYATNMLKDKAGRHYWLAENLIINGYNPTIFCASTLHNSDENIDTEGNIFIKKESKNIPFVIVKTPQYSGNGKKRIINMFSFYKNLFPTAKRYANKYGKPDVILASSVHPLTLVAGIKIAKKLGVPCICEVRDLWPESIVAYGSLKRNSVIAKILYLGEKWIYKNADKLIFTMAGGKDYIYERKWDKFNGGPIDIGKVHSINNGVDLNVFNYNKQNCQYDDEDLNNPEIFKIVYTGSIRLVNKVEMLVDVAKRLRDKKIKILIWGSGDQLKIIQQRITKEQLNNIILKGKVDKKYIPNILSKSNLNIILGGSNDIFRFGLSPNKLFEYFAAGKPILQTFKANYSLVKINKAGLELNDNDPIAISEAIEYFLKLSQEEYIKYCENALAASKEYSYEKLTSRLVNVIESKNMEG